MIEQLDLRLGNSKSSFSCFLLLLAPYGKGGRAPLSSNPPRLSLAASKLQSPLLSSPFLLPFLLECESVEREMN
jgi:hypothetical protein